MEYTFTNGSVEQQQLWRRAVSLLRNLPEEAMPLSIEVSFEPPGEVGQTNFAETTWNYDSTESATKVRNDAPGFGTADAALIAEASRLGLKYNARQHFNETAVHELGHSLFAALPEAARLAICALFGLDTDDDAVLNPQDEDWHDRPIEAIAETFKEAFLPARHRVFPNRTNISLSYAKYPTFRRLMREAMPEVETGELGPEETAVPAYDLDIFAQGKPILEGLFANPLPGSGGRHGLWDSSFGNTESGPGLHNSSLQHQFEWSGWVREGGIAYEFTLPLSAFDPALIGSAYFEPAAVLEQFNEAGFQWGLFARKTPATPLVDLQVLTEAGWYKTVRTAKQVETLAEFGPVVEQPAPGWMLADDAVGGGIPTVTYKGTIPVDAAHFTTAVVCGGHTYRLVTLRGYFNCRLTQQFPETEAEMLRIREEVTYPWMPTLNFAHSACRGGEAGSRVIVPPGRSRALGARAGRVPSRGRVLGARG